MFSELLAAKHLNSAFVISSIKLNIIQSALHMEANTSTMSLPGVRFPRIISAMHLPTAGAAAG